MNAIKRCHGQNWILGTPLMSNQWVVLWSRTSQAVTTSYAIIWLQPLSSTQKNTDRSYISAINCVLCASLLCRTILWMTWHVQLMNLSVLYLLSWYVYINTKLDEKLCLQVSDVRTYPDNSVVTRGKSLFLFSQKHRRFLMLTLRPYITSFKKLNASIEKAWWNWELLQYFGNFHVICKM